LEAAVGRAGQAERCYTLTYFVLNFDVLVDVLVGRKVADLVRVAEDD
jgi:hypothetical protein